jgi:hypothetical protein
MKSLWIAETLIQVSADSGAGQQCIRIQNTAFGGCLAQLLGSENLVLQKGYYEVDHTAEVDELMCSLIDLFISLRYSHPRLLQLTLLSEEVLS